MDPPFAEIAELAKLQLVNCRLQLLAAAVTPESEVPVNEQLPPEPARLPEKATPLAKTTFPAERENEDPTVVPDPRKVVVPPATCTLPPAAKVPCSVVLALPLKRKDEVPKLPDKVCEPPEMVNVAPPIMGLGGVIVAVPPERMKVQSAVIAEV
jgi:hypothetical protein